MKKNIIILLGLCILLSCRKMLELDPPKTNVASEKVYNNEVTAASVLTSIFSRLGGNSLAAGSGGLSINAGIMSDELICYSSDLNKVQLYNNAALPNNYEAVAYWPDLYAIIYTANAAIEGVEASAAIREPLKRQLTGEAKFIRAYAHFYLINLYGNAPLVTTTDYLVNNVAERTPMAKVYEQIVTDLQEAAAALPDEYLTSKHEATAERIRPNKWTAKALLARAYLYMEEWENAEREATDIINNTGLYSLDIPLEDIFLANSKEAIWQLQPVIQGYNTVDAYIFILTEGVNPVNNSYSLHPRLFNALAANDLRFKKWVGVDSTLGMKLYYPYKYKVGSDAPAITEYYMVFRLAEQYLVRAEARAHLGNTDGANADVNRLRARAGVGPVNIADVPQLLLAIERERQAEMFTEQGHRWFDLKRTGRIDAVMTEIAPEKDGSWETEKQLLPLPQSETVVNKRLTQNPGYN